MKKYTEKVSSILLLLFFVIFLSFYQTSSKYQEKLKAGYTSIKGMLMSREGKEEYLSQLLDLGFKENNRQIHLDTITVYQLAEKEKENPRKLKTIFAGGRQKLVIRYTEIGCNSCTDSIFHILDQYPGIRKKYDVLILIDFSNYDSYLKWRKISAPKDSVLWLSKGALPFSIEDGNKSYMFTTNSFMELSDFFIPNSIFPAMIHNYLHNIQSK